MITVILAEKPSQAKAYADSFAAATKHAGYYTISDPIFPNETYITYGFGHLVELVTPDKYDEKYKYWSLDNLPIFPDTYQYTVPVDKREQFEVVKRLLTQANKIIIATDADREGENIAWSIMKYAKVNFKNTEIQRLWINSLERETIRTGFVNLKPGIDFYPKYLEAQTREISDWLVGMNASPLFTLLLKKYGIDGTFSIGRVQTPTLEIVHERQDEIENFIPERYLQLEALITTKTKIEFSAKLEPNQKFFGDKKLVEFMESNHLNLGKQYGEVIDAITIPKTIASPRLFSLSDLQSQVNKLYKVSASATLRAVQNLYEAKLVTYPRTDCNYITKQEFNYLKDTLVKYKRFLGIDFATPNLEPQARYVNDSKVQEHHAIIVTRTIPNIKKLTSLGELEQKIYQLVLRTTIAMFAPHYRYLETTLLFKISQTNFKSVGKTETNVGWKELFGNTKKPEEKEMILPKLVLGELVDADVKMLEKFTQPPELLTEGTLISAMKMVSKKLSDTQEQAILKDTQGIGTEATRANIIEKLKQKKYLTVEKNNLIVSPAGKILCQAVATQPLLVSPEMTAKWELALQQISMQTRTPENFLNQIKHFVKQIIVNTPERIANDQELQNKIALYKSQQPGQKEKLILGNCPRCQTGAIVDKGKFYGCSNYRKDGDCSFTLPKQWSGKKVPINALRDLINNQETKLLKGFKSKNGKVFNAKLKINDDKITFVFPENDASI
ncbi:type IA DNA topoisomerase [Periweissella fabalis]|uniref:DNA topoisomerase n=1 Tax=Periweissella fabalis TaxID=1070421 RepID=A0A7X6S387_9LACO|nr:type IA DNA topoisomerase [Periweissella fabalis]MCM0599438.1 DNA topoisomerase 3 [Periweissella fabalis]NKZ23717.1 DNA topoisomerase 3 [Periweissella fabalis]